MEPGDTDADAFGSGWRVVDGVPTAWFEAPSLSAAAELAGPVLDLAVKSAVELRPSGLRVRLEADGKCEAISKAAGALGLSADPAVLQHIGLAIESPKPSAVRPFWRRTLGYLITDEGLGDPLCRDPSLSLRESSDPRPLRNRIHLDVVRPGPEIKQAGFGPGGGPYGVLQVDADGNEVDLVPGDPLGDSEATADWQNVFSAIACYRTTSRAQQRDLAQAAAALADEAGFPLLVDLRPGLVVLDSGKDQWDADAHGLDLDFLGLAARLQAAAHELGATPDTRLPRYVQLFLDAADVEALKAFWSRALGYVPDRRENVGDILDPRRLEPVLVFQQIDTSETERLAQRNRVHVEVGVPADLAAGRVSDLVEAGGQVLEEQAGRWLVADPEGNELAVVAG